MQRFMGNASTLGTENISRLFKPSITFQANAKYDDELLDRFVKARDSQPIPYNPEDHKRSFLDRSFDLLLVGNNTLAGGVNSALKGDGFLKGAWGGLKASNPFGDGYEEGETSWKDVIETSGWKDDAFFGSNVLRGTAGFVLDVLLDPTTYMTFGTSALLKGSGKLGKSAQVIEELAKNNPEFAQGLRQAGELTDEMAEEIVLRSNGITSKNIADLGDEAYKFSQPGGLQGKAMSRQQLNLEVAELKTTYNKLLGVGRTGQGISVGVKNMPFGDWVAKKIGITSAPKTLIKDSSIRKFSDTIGMSSTYALSRKAIYGSKIGKTLSRNASLMKIAEKSPSKLYDYVAGVAKLQGKDLDKVAREKAIKDLGKTLLDLKPAEQKKIIQALENPSVWREVKDYVTASGTKDWAKLRENYITELDTLKKRDAVVRSAREEYMESSVEGLRKMYDEMDQVDLANATEEQIQTVNAIKEDILKVQKQKEQVELDGIVFSKDYDTPIKQVEREIEEKLTEMSALKSVDAEDVYSPNIESLANDLLSKEADIDSELAQKITEQLGKLKSSPDVPTDTREILKMIPKERIRGEIDGAVQELKTLNLQSTAIRDELRIMTVKSATTPKTKKELAVKTGRIDELKKELYGARLGAEVQRTKIRELVSGYLFGNKNKIPRDIDDARLESIAHALTRMDDLDELGDALLGKFGGTPLAPRNQVMKVFSSHLGKDGTPEDALRSIIDNTDIISPAKTLMNKYLAKKYNYGLYEDVKNRVIALQKKFEFNYETGEYRYKPTMKREVGELTPESVDAIARAKSLKRTLQIEDDDALYKTLLSVMMKDADEDVMQKVNDALHNSWSSAPGYSKTLKGKKGDVSVHSEEALLRLFEPDESGKMTIRNEFKQVDDNTERDFLEEVYQGQRDFLEMQDLLKLMADREAEAKHIMAIPDVAERIKYIKDARLEVDKKDLIKNQFDELDEEWVGNEIINGQSARKMNEYYGDKPHFGTNTLIEEDVVMRSWSRDASVEDTSRKFKSNTEVPRENHIKYSIPAIQSDIYKARRDYHFEHSLNDKAKEYLQKIGKVKKEINRYKKVREANGTDAYDDIIKGFNGELRMLRDLARQESNLFDIDKMLKTPTEYDSVLSVIQTNVTMLMLKTLAPNKTYPQLSDKQRAWFLSVGYKEAKDYLKSVRLDREHIPTLFKQMNEDNGFYNKIKDKFEKEYKKKAVTLREKESVVLHSKEVVSKIDVDSTVEVKVGEQILRGRVLGKVEETQDIVRKSVDKVRRNTGEFLEKPVKIKVTAKDEKGNPIFHPNGKPKKVEKTVMRPAGMKVETVDVVKEEVIGKQGLGIYKYDVQLQDGSVVNLQSKDIVGTYVDDEIDDIINLPKFLEDEVARIHDDVKKMRETVYKDVNDAQIEAELKVSALHREAQENLNHIKAQVDGSKESILRRNEQISEEVKKLQAKLRGLKSASSKQDKMLSNKERIAKVKLERLNEIEADLIARKNREVAQLENLHKLEAEYNESFKQAYKQADQAVGGARVFDEELTKIETRIKQIEDALDADDQMELLLKLDFGDEAYIKMLDSMGATPRISLVADGYDAHIKLIAERIRHDFISAGIDEIKIGKLDEGAMARMMDRYFPRTLSEQGKAFFDDPTNLEKYKAVAREYGFGKEFTPHGKSRTDENRFKSLYQLNDELEAVTGVRIFEENLGKAYVDRMLTSSEVVYDNRAMKDLMFRFGYAIGKDNKVKDGYMAVVNYGMLKEFVREKATANVTEMLKGRGKEKLPDGEFQRLFDQEANGIMKSMELDPKILRGETTPFIKVEDPSQIGLIKNVAGRPMIRQVNTQTIDRANQARQLIMERDSHRLVQLYDKFMTFFKLNQTTVSPAFHTRNHVGAMFVGWLGVGRDALNVGKHKEAYQALKIYGDQMALRNLRPISPDEFGGKTYYWDEIMELANGFRVIDEGFMMKDFASHSYSDGTKIIPGKYDPLNTKEFFAYKIGGKVATYSDNINRLVQFSSLLRQGKTPYEASETVRKYMFDYSDLTTFEKRWMKRIFPYYTFMRKNIPLMAHEMIDNPEKMMLMAKIHNGINSMTPESEQVGQNEKMGFAQDWLQMPFNLNSSGMTGEAEQPVLMNPTLPYMQLRDINMEGDIGEQMRTLFSQSAPMLKVPIELATNWNSYFDSELVAEDGNQISPRLAHVGSQLIAFNVVKNFMDAKTGDDKVLALLNATTGVKMSTYDVEGARQKIQEEAYDNSFKFTVKNLIGSGVQFSKGLVDNARADLSDMAVSLVGKPYDAFDEDGVYAPVSTTSYESMSDEDKKKYSFDADTKSYVANRALEFEQEQYEETGIWKKFMWTLIDDKDGFAEKTVARVDKITDGDTFVGRQGDETFNVRLLLVDTPEKYNRDTPQDYSLEASAFTSEMILGKDVKLYVDEATTHGRRLAFVEVGGKSLQEELLSNGFGKVRQYDNNFTEEAEELYNVEEGAYKQKLGVWGVDTPPLPRSNTGFQR